MIAVAAAPTDKRFPVVVECLDATGRRMVLAESDNLVEMGLERFVELAHGHIVTPLGAPQDSPEAQPKSASRPP